MGKHKKKNKEKEGLEDAQTGKVKDHQSRPSKSSTEQKDPIHEPKSSWWMKSVVRNCLQEEKVEGLQSHRSKSSTSQDNPSHRTNASMTVKGIVGNCQSSHPRLDKRATASSSVSSSSPSKSTSSKRKRKASAGQPSSHQQSRRKVARSDSGTDIKVTVPSSEPSTKTPTKERTRTRRRKRKRSTGHPYSHLTQAEKDVVINFSFSSPKTIPKNATSTSQPLSSPPSKPAKHFHVPSKLTGKNEEQQMSSPVKSKHMAKSPVSPSESRVTPKTTHSSHSKTFGDSVIVIEDSPTPKPSNLVTSTPFPSSRRDTGFPFSPVTPIVPSSFSFASQKATSAHDVTCRLVSPFVSLPDSKKSTSSSEMGKTAFPNVSSSECQKLTSSHKLDDTLHPVFSASGFHANDAFSTQFPSGNQRSSATNLSDQNESGIIITSPPSSDTLIPSHDNIWSPKGIPMDDSCDPNVTVINQAGNSSTGSGNDSNTVIVIDSATTICLSPEPAIPFEVIEVLDSDAEEMEVDDDEMMQSLLTVREQTTNLEASVAGSLSETIINATVIKAASPVKVTQIVLVIDTNVLIHSPVSFSNLLKVQVPGQGRPIVLLPWMVILELDQLKVDRPGRNRSDPAVAFRARSAARLLQNLVMERHPQLVCQKATEVNEDLSIPIHSNDDRILHCCLQWKKRHKNDRVVLVTRDRNLSTKAMILDVETCTNDDLWSQLKGQDSHQPVVDRTGCSTVSDNNNGPLKVPARNLNGPNLGPPSNQTGKPGVNQNNKNYAAHPVVRTGPVQAYQPQPYSQCNDGKHKQVVEKFTSVWDLILFSRSDLETVRNVGPSHPRFSDGRAYLERLTEQIIGLKIAFVNCINLSPVMLSSNMADDLFRHLEYCLNTFFRNTGTSISDRAGNVTRQQLISYFSEVKNRLRLAQAAEELDEIITSLRHIFPHYL